MIRFSFLPILVQAFLVMLIPGNTCKPTVRWETVLDKSSFSEYSSFEANWNYLYPWGEDHNGSARMIAGPDNHTSVKLIGDNTLQITAIPLQNDVGKSVHPPYQKIRYQSGAIHARHKIVVNEQYPVYDVSGEFKAPIAKGSWPAFWLTAVNGWPPETDILEFKGDDVNWQNTFITPKNVATIKTRLTDADSVWHTYRACLRTINKTDIEIDYYIDGVKTGTHQANFTDKPLWLIINLQMEGSSGMPGPGVNTHYYIRNIIVKRGEAIGE